MVKSRTEKELDLIRKSGRISASALKKSLQGIQPGVSCLELEKIAAEEIKSLGGELAFPTVDDYKWATCITINEQVVHGIPTDRIIQPGDLVSIDVGAIYGGWFTDTAWTVLVPSVNGKDPNKDNFLKIGEQALWEGVKYAVEGRQIGDISSAIQSRIEGAGFHIIRSLVGHGVGKQLHEEPEVPGYGKPHTGLTLKPGMTLAIEVIYSEGTSEVKLEADRWTYSSADGSISGLFEMSVIVGKKFAQVLTDWRKV